MSLQVFSGQNFCHHGELDDILEEKKRKEKKRKEKEINKIILSI